MKTDPAKILLILEDLNLGGGQNYGIQLARFLQRKSKYSPIVAHGEGRFFKPALEELGIATHQFKIGRFTNYWQHAKNGHLLAWFLSLYKEHKIQLVHFFSGTVPTFACISAAFTQLPTVYTPMSIYANGLIQRQLYYKKYPLRAWLVDRFITHYQTLSQFMYSEYVEQRGIEKYKVSLNWLGVNLERFCSVSADVRSQLGLPEDGLIALVAARLHPMKRVEVAIDAVATALSCGSRINLIIVGDGECRKSLEEQCLRLEIEDHVKFLGSVNNQLMPQLYASSDVYLMTTLNPNLGLAALEALASGLPLLGYAANREEAIMLQDTCEMGKNGYIVSSSFQLGQRLHELASNLSLLTSMKKASRNLAESSFDEQKHWQNVELMYDDLLS